MMETRSDVFTDPNGRRVDHVGKKKKESIEEKAVKRKACQGFVVALPIFFKDPNIYFSPRPTNALSKGKTNKETLTELFFFSFPPPAFGIGRVFAIHIEGSKVDRKGLDNSYPRGEKKGKRLLVLFLPSCSLRKSRHFFSG